jgi:hypothetical protein
VVPVSWCIVFCCRQRKGSTIAMIVAYAGVH